MLPKAGCWILTLLFVAQAAWAAEEERQFAAAAQAAFAEAKPELYRQAKQAYSDLVAVRPNDARADYVFAALAVHYRRDFEVAPVLRAWEARQEDLLPLRRLMLMVALKKQAYRDAERMAVDLAARITARPTQRGAAEAAEFLGRVSAFAAGFEKVPPTLAAKLEEPRKRLNEELAAAYDRGAAAVGKEAERRGQEAFEKLKERGEKSEAEIATIDEKTAALKARGMEIAAEWQGLREKHGAEYDLVQAQHSAVSRRLREVERAARDDVKQQEREWERGNDKDDKDGKGKRKPRFTSRYDEDIDRLENELAPFSNRLRQLDAIFAPVRQKQSKVEQDLKQTEEARKLVGVKAKRFEDAEMVESQKVGRYFPFDTARERERIAELFKSSPVTP